MLKHIGKLNTFLLIQSLKSSYWVIQFFQKNVGIKIIGTPKDYSKQNQKKLNLQ